QAVGDGVLDAAGLLVRVRAVGEAAAGEERAELGEVARDFLRVDVPQFHLPDARRINHPAAKFELQQAGAGRRVTALAALFADFARFQLQARLDGIQQRGFSDAALPRKSARAILQQVPQAWDAGSTFRTREDDIIAQLGIEA